MNKNKKIVAIGAGIAGLTAALRLQHAGLNVHLYEARNRVGGRIFTAKINEQIAELGAQNLKDGGEATHLHQLINEFNLNTQSTLISFNHDYFDGKNLISIDKLIKDKRFDPETLYHQLKHYAEHTSNMQEVLNQLLDQADPLYKTLSVRLAGWEGGFPAQLSSKYVDTLYHMILGGICSVHQMSEQESFIQLETIEGGNGLLPEKMAQSLGSHLHLNMPVKKIGKQPDGSYQLTFANGQQTVCNVLVLAIPCSVYSSIIFENDVIPQSTLNDIQNVRYGMNAKIMIPFSENFSNQAGLVSDHILSFFDHSQKILTIYYSRPSSLFSQETIQTALMQAFPMIEKKFGERCPNFENLLHAKDESFIQYASAIGYSWPNDPYAQGTYSYISPGQEKLLTTFAHDKGELFKTLFAPIENLYFAGEHASILLETPGTMEAACESGNRVARVIKKDFE